MADATPTCVWKGGDPAIASQGTGKPLLPCNPNVDPGAASSCCIQGDSCLASGMCYGAAGMPYRGACTDATKYGTSACPDNCVDIIPSGVANMYGCTAGVKNNGGIMTFWCGLGTPCNSSSDNNGETTATGWFPNGVIVRSANTSSPLPSPNAVPASPSASSNKITCSSCHEGAVGGGVGGGLGAVILVLAVLLIFERRKRRRSNTIDSTPTHSNDGHSHLRSTSGGATGYGPGTQHSGFSYDKKESPVPFKPELPDDGTSKRAELGGSYSPKHEVP